LQEAGWKWEQGGSFSKEAEKMGLRYGDYEYESMEKDTTDKAEDWEVFPFKVTNIKTGKMFKYKVAIAFSALASVEGLSREYRPFVETKGEAVVQKWLDDKCERNMQAAVAEEQGKEVEIDNENWRNWDDLFEEIARFKAPPFFF
jgi:hypothetical protein